MNPLLTISVLFYYANGLENSANCKVNKVANSDKENAECWINSDLSQLNCGPAWDTVHLEVIHVDHSTTKVGFHPSVFTQCDQLHVLAIWENSQLTWLQRDIFQPLRNLERLVVRSNKLTTIDLHLLVFLPGLQYLSITDSSYLNHLDRKMFDPCPSSLSTLDLSNNQIGGSLQPELFQSCSLLNLYLNENQIISLTPGALAGLSNLRFIRLDKNRLAGSLEEALGGDQAETQSALASTPNLEVLDLSANQLTEIKGSSWSSGVLLKLRILNLANNKLQWLDPEAFKRLYSLTELRLEGNMELLHPDGISSLAVNLFGFSTSLNRQLRHLIIPEQGLELDVCSPERTPSSLKIINSVVNVLRNSACNYLDLKATAPLLIAEAEIIETKEVQINDEGPVLQFIRTTHRWVLACIGLGLLLIGVFISSLIFCCLFAFRRPPEIQEKKQATSMQLPQKIPYQALNTSLTSIETPHIYTTEAGYSNYRRYTPILRPQQFPGSIQQRQQRYNLALASPPANARKVLRGSHQALTRDHSPSLYSLLPGPTVAHCLSLNALNLRPVNAAKQAMV